MLNYNRISNIIELETCTKSINNMTSNYISIQGIKNLNINKGYNVSQSFTNIMKLFACLNARPYVKLDHIS